MTREEIAEDMKHTIGAFPNVSQFARYMGWSRNRARAWLADIPPVKKTQRFYLDIVEKLCEETDATKAVESVRPEMEQG